MKKLVVAAAILVSINSFAATNIFRTVVVNSFQNSINTHTQEIKLYGGQDFSRSLLATADEPLWKGQPTLIG